MNLDQKYFDFISEGKKTFEGRLLSDKNKSLSIGDWILFRCGPRSIRVRIDSIHIFRTYEEAMKILDFKKMVPDAKTPEEAIRVYERYYPLEKQLENKICVFGITLVGD